MRRVIVAIATLAAGCPAARGPGGGGAPDAAPAFAPGLGATYEPDGAGIVFRIAAPRATRVELSIYAEPEGAPETMHVALDPEGDGVWRTRLATAELPPVVYYGYRVWGPSWTYDPAWTPGSDAGFVARVTADGDRMNPNKLLIDPYAREISHDPIDRAPMATDAAHRDLDDALTAPKSIALPPPAGDPGPHPARAFRDDVVYEVHLRGLTAGDAAATCPGTYAAAAARAQTLADLGITAVEFLPVQETPNDQNDVDPTSDAGDNYWGYSTLAYFAPDRRYACDRSPGGPTREFQDMVAAFHAHGIQVLIDVVYNHTSEGGGGSLLSLRGIDNAAYYELDDAGTGFADQTGIGASTNATSPLFRDLVLDSLHYWHDVLGVDGFRFDLAPVLGNTCARGCFHFDATAPGNILARAAAEFPGAPLVAEPWAIGAGTYQLGNFPAGWSEWNDRFRRDVRQSVNLVGVVDVTLRSLIARLSGSPDVFDPATRAPDASVDYVASHDGFTLRDVVSCNQKSNAQPWPYGPSSGGDDSNDSWDYGGDDTRQRQAARTLLALELLGAGVPMIEGGDEMLRSQRCNNNPYDLDSVGTWLDWSQAGDPFVGFAKAMIGFRNQHPALRPSAWRGAADQTWIGTDGLVLPDRFLDDPTARFLGWRIAQVPGEPARSIYVAYNGAATALTITLPPDASWTRVIDTKRDVSTPAAIGSTYRIEARSLAVFVEQ